MANCCLVGVAFVLCLLSLPTNANEKTSTINALKEALDQMHPDPALDESVWGEIASLKQTIHTSHTEAQKSAKMIVQWFDMTMDQDATKMYSPKTLKSLVKLIRSLIAYSDLVLGDVCHNNGDCDDNNACTRDTCEDNCCQSTPIPGCIPCEDHADCATSDRICSCGNDGTCSWDCVDIECHSDAECMDDNVCTKDSCVAGSCLNQKIPHCALCEMDTDCNDWDKCTFDKCVGGTCTSLPIPNCDCTRIGGFLCEETESCVQNCNDCKKGTVGNEETGTCCDATRELCEATGTYWCAKYEKCVPNCAKCGDDVFEASSGECVSDCASEGMFLCPSSGGRAAPCVIGCIDDCPGFEATNYEKNTCEIATKASCIACHTYYCEVEKRCVEDCDECPDSTLNKGSKAMYVPGRELEDDRFDLIIPDQQIMNYIPGKEPYCEPVEEETETTSASTYASDDSRSRCPRGFYCSRLGGYVADCCVECGDVPRENLDSCKCEFGWRPLEFVAKQWKQQPQEWTEYEPADEAPMASAGRIIQMATLAGQAFPQCHYTLIIPRYMWTTLFYRNFFHLRPDEAYDIVMSWVIPDGAYTWDELLAKKHHHSLFGRKYETAMGWPRVLTEEGNQWFNAWGFNTKIRPEGSTWDIDIYNEHGQGIVRNSFTLLKMFETYDPTRIIYGFPSQRSRGGDGLWIDPQQDDDDGPDVLRFRKRVAGAGQEWYVARVVETDMECDGGFVHLVDNVLIPPMCEDRAHSQSFGQMYIRGMGPAFYGGGEPLQAAVGPDFTVAQLMQGARLESTPWLGQWPNPFKLPFRRSGAGYEGHRDIDDGYFNYEQLPLFNYHCYPRMSCDADSQCDGFGIETCRPDPWGECGYSGFQGALLLADDDDSFDMKYGPKCSTYCANWEDFDDEFPAPLVTE